LSATINACHAAPASYRISPSRAFSSSNACSADKPRSSNYAFTKTSNIYAARCANSFAKHNSVSHNDADAICDSNALDDIASGIRDPFARRTDERFNHARRRPEIG